MLFWHSTRSRISYFDIQNPILHSKQSQISYLDINILFWHSCWCRRSDFYIQKPILTFNRARISYFNIQNPIWHSNYGQKSYFDIKSPIMTSEFQPSIVFYIQSPILTFEMKPKILFWHSKSYFDILTVVKYRILTFDIQNTILGLNSNVKIGFYPKKKDFWMAKCDFHDQFECQNRIFNVKKRFSALFRMSN